uniref:Uncharacterized protein n=1 Tax=Rhizophora mucronata TaxID=61149 RepID=A0A2P2P7J7_RHIMU
MNNIIKTGNNIIHSFRAVNFL